MKTNISPATKNDGWKMKCPFKTVPLKRVNILSFSEGFGGQPRCTHQQRWRIKSTAQGPGPPVTQIQHEASKLCIDAGGEHKPILYPCHTGRVNQPQKCLGCWWSKFLLKVFLSVFLEVSLSFDRFGAGTLQSPFKKPLCSFSKHLFVLRYPSHCFSNKNKCQVFHMMENS